MYIAGVWEEKCPLPGGSGCLGSTSQSPEPPSSAPACVLVLLHQPTALAQSLGHTEPQGFSCEMILLSTPPCSWLQGGHWGLASPSYPSTRISTTAPRSCSEPWQPHCHRSQRIALEKAWSHSCGSCTHTSGCLRPNNMVLSCDPALLKV